MQRIKVTAVRAANGRIQGWAVNHGNYEVAFYRANTHGDRAHTHALNHANRYWRIIHDDV